MEKLRVNGDQEREKFFEGAAWAARQCTDSNAKAVKSIENVRVEYNDRINEAGENHFMRLRAAEWLMDTNERICK
jgi:hypothetical protein